MKPARAATSSEKLSKLIDPVSLPILVEAMINTIAPANAPAMPAKKVLKYIAIFVPPGIAEYPTILR